MFKDIPYHDGFKIDINGRVISDKENVIKAYKNDKGYLIVRVKDDNGHSRLRRLHRLIMLTYGPKNPYWETDLVNHLNGDKEDIRLINLEWACSGRNNRHAYEMGLNKNGIPFIVYDRWNDQEQTYHNTRHASIYMGLSQQEIYETIKIKSMSDDGRYLFKGISDERPWEEILRAPNMAIVGERYKLFDDAIVVRKAGSELSTIFETVNAVVAHTGLNRETVIKRLLKCPDIPAKGWVIHFTDVEVPTYTVEEAAFLEKAFGNSKPQVITDTITGKETLYLSLYDFVRDIGLDVSRASNIRDSFNRYKHYTREVLVEIKPFELLEYRKALMTETENESSDGKVEKSERT